jgi:membrane protease subunit (stomatin/prohibitin family)
MKKWKLQNGYLGCWDKNIKTFDQLYEVIESKNMKDTTVMFADKEYKFNLNKTSLKIKTHNKTQVCLNR